MNKLFVVLILLIIICCTNSNQCENYSKTDMELFHQTQAWELVKAIEHNDCRKIQEIISMSPELINFQEPLYGISPLQRAVGTRKIEAVKTLITLGANVNLKSKIGDAPIFDAIGYEWNDYLPSSDGAMLHLLLKNGADPNLLYSCPPDEEEVNVIEDCTSPLMYAIAYSSGYQLVKLLVEYGADINYKTRMGNTAAIEALKANDVESAYYLIVVLGAEISKPYYYCELGTSMVDFNEPFYPIDLLLNWIYDLESKEYSMKMDIVKKIEENGYSYDDRKKNIPQSILRKIKKMHPDNWQEYIKKY